jgi:flagellar biosynthesis regulator FlaF
MDEQQLQLQQQMQVQAQQARAKAMAAASSKAAIGKPSVDPKEIDVAVLQYAQWLSEIKIRSTSAQHQQNSDIALLKETMTTHGNGLAEFKRHTSAVQQQLLAQVAELREKLSDCFAEIATLARQKAEVDMRAQQELQAFREVLTSKNRELEAIRKANAEHVSTLQAQLSQCAAKLTAAENEMAILRRSSAQQHDSTLAKFNEVDRSMEVFHSSMAQNRKIVDEVKAANREEREWVHQALDNLQSEVEDYKKEHMAQSTKVAAQVYVLEEASKINADKRAKMEGILDGVQQVSMATQNNVNLLQIQQEASYMPGTGRSGSQSYTGSVTASQATTSLSALSRPR